MSLITRCPACGTLFKVVPDQLRISEGWVRCGQCEEVFDGNAHLQQGPLLQSQPPSNDPPASSSVASEATSEESSADYDWSDVLGKQDSPAGQDAPRSMQVDRAADAHAEPEVRDGSYMQQEQVAQIADAPADAFQDEPAADHAGDFNVVSDYAVEPAALVHGAIAQPADDPVLSATPAHMHGPEPEPALDEATVTDEDAASAQSDELNLSPLGTLAEFDAMEAGESLRYVQADAPLPAPLQDPRPSFMTRKPVRKRGRFETLGLGLVTAVLVLLLMGQVLMRERDRIAAYQPALKPVLQGLCQGFGCQVESLRQIESLVIESSSFSKIRGDTYRLGFAIRNPAHIPLALPAMELTLTDSQDKVLLRRVLQVTDFAHTDALEAASEFSANLAVQVKLGSLNERITGYRLLAFYP